MDRCGSGCKLLGALPRPTSERDELQATGGVHVAGKHARGVHKCSCTHDARLAAQQQERLTRHDRHAQDLHCCQCSRVRMTLCACTASVDLM
eukprot:scaffold47276_cov22-Tisochrysis_lutea.AAC.2